MNDQMIPADKVRDLHRDAASGASPEDVEAAREWADDVLDGRAAAIVPIEETIARALRAYLPPPPLPTLADMPYEGRKECRWMQADSKPTGSRVVILEPNWTVGTARVLRETGRAIEARADALTPRPDLPRLEWPGTEKPAPAPALPDGWRLADHKDLGRGIVTNTTPNRNGHVYFVLPDDEDHRGYGEGWCDPEELTYIDQEAEDVTPVKVGDVIESADDPRLAALPVGSVLLDRDRETVAKRDKVWAGLGYIPIESEGDEFGPWTVRRIGWGADQ